MSDRIDNAIQILGEEIQREKQDLQTIPKTRDNQDLIYAGNYRVRVMEDRLEGLRLAKKQIGRLT
jgi:hypothetical protein